MRLLKVIKLPPPPIPTKWWGSLSTSSPADLKLVHTEEMDILEDVEAWTNEGGVDSSNVGVEVEELLVAEAQAKLPPHDLAQYHVASQDINLILSPTQ
jgi:hypothetical protein